jgi:pseudo-rSAM protein
MRYFFYIESYVYYNQKGDKHLLINSINNDYKIFILNEIPTELLPLFEKLYSNPANTSIELNKDIFILLKQSSFVSLLREKFIADLVEVVDKPFFFFKQPLIDEKNIVGNKEPFKFYLNEIEYYIQGDYNDEPKYAEASKHCGVPYSFWVNSKFDKNIFLQTIQIVKSRGITLVLNIFNAENIDLLDEIFQLIYRSHIKFQLNIMLDDFLLFRKKFDEMLNWETKSVQVYVCLFDNCIESKLETLRSLKHIDYKSYTFIFVVQNSKELKVAEKTIQKSNISNYMFVPFVNNVNDLFIEENVSYTKVQILNQEINFTDQLTNSRINTNFFGKIVISPNGDIFISKNKSKIGNLYDIKDFISFYSDVLMNDKKDWFLTRQKLTVCKNCLMDKLCPPIGELELYTKKYNFCKQQI